MVVVTDAPTDGSMFAVEGLVEGVAAAESGAECRVLGEEEPWLLRYLRPSLGCGGGSSVLTNIADGTDTSSCQILSCSGPGDLSL